MGRELTISWRGKYFHPPSANPSVGVTRTWTDDPFRTPFRFNESPPPGAGTLSTYHWYWNVRGSPSGSRVETTARTVLPVVGAWGSILTCSTPGSACAAWASGG